MGAVEASPSRLLLADDRPLIIVDNSLVDDRGHNLALARTISKAALASGRRVVIYAHHSLDPDLLPRNVELRRIFRLSVYEHFAGKLVDHDMVSELISVLTEMSENQPEGGLVLFHTADAFVFCAIAGWLQKDNTLSKLLGKWNIHLVTPYEPRLMPGFSARARQLHQSLNTLARWGGPSVSLYFWTETARLAEFYRRAYSLKTAVLQLPAPKWASDPAIFRPPRHDKLVLLFLGAAREEKGFLQLPAIANEIAARPAVSEKVVMRIQRSAPISGMQTKVVEAFAKLEKFPFVEIIEGVLDQLAYASEMRACDMVLLLYSATNYFARGSGIVMETLCSGKRALATRGTFMENIDHGGMLHFGSDPSEWIDHVERLTRNLDNSRLQSGTFGQRFAARYSAERYIETLEQRSLLDRHFTSIHKIRQFVNSPTLVALPGAQSDRQGIVSRLKGRR